MNKRNEANTDGVLHGLRTTIGDLQSTVSTFGAEAQSRAGVLTAFVEDVVSRKAAEIRALSEDLEQASYPLAKAPMHVLQRQRREHTPAPPACPQIVSDVDASATRQSQAMTTYAASMAPDVGGGSGGGSSGSSPLSAKLSAVASRLRAIEADSGEWRDSTAAALAASEAASRRFVDALSARLADLAGAAALAREEVTDALRAQDAALAEHSAAEAERRTASAAALTAAVVDLMDKHAREAGRQSEAAVSKLRAGVAGAQEGVARRGRAMQDAITAVTLLGQHHVGEVAKSLDSDNRNLQDKHAVRRDALRPRSFLDSPSGAAATCWLTAAAAAVLLLRCPGGCSILW